MNRIATRFRFPSPALRCGASTTPSPRYWATLLLALVALLLGPATGALHAVHLAHAGAHHHADECSFCQQALAGSHYVADPPPVIIARLDISFLRLAMPSMDCPRNHAPDPVLPRAPPWAACAQGV